ncbi:MAG: hypothetical protein QF754_17500 [Alphaproteobacteria bacterium]|nr:hypothetical protein [Alphaproteobacteria bacterium]
MTLEIGGAEYWLAKVFTLDLDGDGHVDNIGFRLRSDEGQDRTLRYRIRGKKLSASDFPKLRLADEQLISRMCPSSVSFREPVEEILQVKEEPEKKQDQKGFSVPDLAKQSRRDKGSTEPVKRSEGKTWTTPVWLWVVAGGAIALLVLGGIVVVLLMGRRKSGDDGDEEDDDYEDEED